MLKTSGSTESLTQSGKGGVKVGGDSRARRNRNELDRWKVNSDEVENDEIEKKVQKLSKSKNLSKSKKTVGSDFLTPKAKLAFTKLRQAFVKALILYHFNPERYIWIKTDVLGYTIDRVLNQLTLNNLDQLHLAAFFSRKMILAWD